MNGKKKSKEIKIEAEMGEGKAKIETIGWGIVEEEEECKQKWNGN